MACLSVRNLILALSLSLLLCAGLITGGLSLDTCDRAMERSELAGAENVELMAKELMLKTMEWINADLNAYVYKPKQVVEVLTSYTAAHTLAEQTSSTWIAENLATMMWKMFEATAYKAGVSMVSYAVRGISPWYLESVMGCDGEIHDYFPRISPGTLLKDVAPKQCGVCVDTESPTTSGPSPCIDDPDGQLAANNFDCKRMMGMFGCDNEVQGQRVDAICPGTCQVAGCESGPPCIDDWETMEHIHPGLDGVRHLRMFGYVEDSSTFENDKLPLGNPLRGFHQQMAYYNINVTQTYDLNSSDPEQSTSSFPFSQAAHNKLLLASVNKLGIPVMHDYDGDGIINYEKSGYYTKGVDCDFPRTEKLYPTGEPTSIGMCVYPNDMTQQSPDEPARPAKFIEGGWIPPGKPRWGSVSATASLISLRVFAAWASDELEAMPIRGKSVGWVEAAIDVLGMSQVLRAVANEEYGGTLPIGSRLYMVERSTVTYEVKWMIGASHGQAYIEAVDFDSEEGRKLLELGNGSTEGLAMPKFLRAATDATDPVIRAHATDVLGTTAGYAGFDPTVMNNWMHNGNLYWSVIRNITDDPTCDPFVEKGCLCLWTTMLIPVDEALKEIRASVIKVNKQRDEDRDRLIYIIAALIVVLIALSLVLTLQIVRPLEDLNKDMAGVAGMKLDGVDADAAVSRLQEIGAMQTSFFAMIKALIEYRRYLPASLLAQLDGGGAEESDAGDECMDSPREGEDDGAAGGSKKPVASASTKKTAATQSRATQQTQKKRASHDTQLQAQKAKKTMTSGVTRKKVTLSVANVRAFHSSVDSKKSEKQTLDVHKGIIQCYIKCCDAAKGVPDVFSGDRMMMTFNAVRNLATHKTAGAIAAAAVQKALTTLGEELVTQSRTGSSTTASAISAAPLSASVGVATGDAKCGNMGCDTMMRFSLLGTTVSFAYAVERYGRQLCAEHPVLDHMVQAEVKNNYLLRQMGRVELPKRGQKKPAIMWEMMGAKAVGEDEWMYQLEEGEKNNPWATWDQCVALLEAGNFSGAAETLEKLESQATAAGPLLDKMKNLVKTEQQWDTTTITYH